MTFLGLGIKLYRKVQLCMYKASDSISHMGKSIKKNKHGSFRKREKYPQNLKVAIKRSSPRRQLNFQNLHKAAHKQIKDVSRLLKSLHQHHPAVPQTRYHFPIPRTCPFPSISLDSPQSWKYISMVTNYKDYPYIIK